VVFIIFGTAICCRTFASSVVEPNIKNKKNSDSLHLLESQSSTSQSSSLICDLDNLKLIELIGRGRYGSVWKGTLNEQTVAVKIFASQYRQYYLNEKEIYCLPFMEFHHCLPRFLGSQERITIDGRTDYHLVLSYAPFGCLQDYLRDHTIDWSTMCKMVQTTTQGLAYLHSEIKKSDKLKPCVAHRDLSSRNIIVKVDGSCMICDFQFAIRISGSKYYSCGEIFDSQTASLNDVGTLRYMAPEILEGAVNLRDCESALKQIDVYALGLVLWEIASRCSDLYQGVEVPNYKQPFEHEIGQHPTFEQMQVLVTRNKARPLFPDIWKDSNPAIRSLKETIEDCWDHDAEARLTALCVEERLMELPLLWERYKSGTLTNCVVGALYSTQSQNFPNINNQKNPFRIRNGSNSFHNIISDMSSEGSEKLTNELQKNRCQNRLDFPNNNIINNSNNVNEDSLVSFSPSSDFEKNIVSAANAFINQPKLTLPLQPHQGRNPCLERNLMPESSDDNTSGLLEHGLKFQVNNSNQDSLITDVFNEGNSTNETNSALVSSDILSRTTNDNSRNVIRRVGNGTTPIPFVQNAVGVNTIPKQPNVPGNGHSVQIKKTNETPNSGHQTNTASGFSKLLNRTNLKSWLNLKYFSKRNENIDIGLIEERQPFSATNDNNGTNVLETQPHNIINVRPIFNSMISQTAINSETDNSITEPKATQINFINGSPLISIIDMNDKSDNTITNNTISDNIISNNTISNNWSNQNSVLIEANSMVKSNISIETPSNIDTMYKQFDETNLNPLTQSSEPLQTTHLKESSVKCDKS
jgi:bone morphogenetic protein receptor type-2